MTSSTRVETTADPARVGRYIAALVAVAIAVSALATAVGGAQPAPSPWLLVALWAGTVVAGVSLVRLRLLSGISESTTVVEIALVPVTVLLAPAWAVALTFSALLVSESIRTPGQPQKIVYNIAAQVAAVAAGATVYAVLGGPGFAVSPPQVLAALVAAATLVTLNNATFLGLMSAVSGRGVRTAIREEGADLFGLDYGVAATGVLVAVLAVAAPLALPLLAVPTVLDQARIRARRDRYELAAAKESAEAANRAKSEFLSRMSHELRTPLNAILGFGQLLELHDELDDDARELVTPILRSGRHLLALIDEILDISRIEAGRMAVSPESIRVSDVAGEALDLVGPLAAEHDVEVRLEASTPELAVLADRQRLKQVLINLLSNAVKYNHPGGEAVLRAHAGGGTIRIEVTDTGPGIPVEDVERLFAPFERLQADDRGIQGSGLGLSISRHLIELMDGELTVRSDPGDGSTFAISLPGLPPEEAGGSPSSAKEESVLPLQEPARLRVVYVEDNPSNLLLVSRILSKRRGITITPASDAAVGLAIIRDRIPDLVLLDLHLPGVNGDEVLRELQADPVLATIPVVILSADASPRRAEQLLAAGAAAYLTKPLDVAELLALVDELSTAPPSTLGPPA